MDKLTAIKIKYDDGTYSDEIPVSVLSENVEWDSTHTLVDVLGSIDVDVTGTIQDQISQLFNEKVSATELNNYVANQLNTDVTNWLNTNVNPVGSAVVVDSSLTVSGAAADAKVTGDEIVDLKSAIAPSIPQALNKFPASYFHRGNLHTIMGHVLNDCTNRISTKNDIAFDYAVTLIPKTGFRFALLYKSGVSYTTQGYKTEAFTIPANQVFKFTIARLNGQEDSSEVADYNLFTDQVVCTSTHDGNILRILPQTLTDTEKSTVRTNIGAMGSAELQTEVDNREEKDTELEKNIIVVENALGIKSTSLFDSSDFVNGYVGSDGDINYANNHIVTKNKLYIPSGSVI